MSSRIVERTEKTCHRFCYVCEKETHACCKICNRDICIDHRVPDPEDHGDYSYYYCKSCWNISIPFLEEYEKITAKYDEDIDILFRQRKLLCLAVVGETK